jgi:hypothetical protein
MKIVNNQEKEITFGSLKYGDVFKSDNGYFWIKMQGVEGFNALDLEEGEPGFFENSETVIPLPNTRLVID